MVWFYERPRTLRWSTCDEETFGRREFTPAVPDPGARYEVYSIINGEPPLPLSVDEAVDYLCDPHTATEPYHSFGWKRDVARTILANLRVGDEIIPDEQMACEERLVRVE